MKTGLIIRRLHLYSGLLLLMFLIKFGLSAIPFSHGIWMSNYYKDKPQWETRFERDYDLEIPEDADLTAIGARVLDDLELKGSYGAWRNGPNRLTVNIFSFKKNVRIIYLINEKRITVEDKLFRWDHFLTKFHWIGGYMQNRLIHDLFALFIDLVCFGILVWVATGLYMWWKKPSTRFWGIVALSSGWISFILILIMS